MNKYFLQINEPCHQKWDQMTTTQQGKFCTSCSKQVIDFTTFTDAQIAAYVEKANGNLFCGNFDADQLGRWIEGTNVEISHPKIYKILLSLMLLAGGQNLQAQDSTKVKNVKVEKIKSNTLKNNGKSEESCIPTIKLNTDTSVKVRLRGGVSSLSNFAKPLLVIDGKLVKLDSLNNISPNDIEAVKVLKGAEATALYGSEAANGVLLVFTKKPKAKLKIPKPLFL